MFRKSQKLLKHSHSIDFSSFSAMQLEGAQAHRSTMKIVVCASLLVFLQLASCAENSVNVNVKNVVNVISDKFVSFSVDFLDLLEILKGGQIKRFGNFCDLLKAMN